MSIRFYIVLAAALALSIASTALCGESDAAVDEYHAELTLDLGEPVTVDIHDLIDGSDYDYCLSSISGVPGVSKDGFILSGTPDTLGDYEVTYRFRNGAVSIIDAAKLHLTVHVREIPEKFTVTYDAGIGTVMGSRTWTEEITEGGYASLPPARFSSGAYTFLGWSPDKTALEGVGSFIPGSDITLHAIWYRNTVLIGDTSAVISQCQRSSLDLETDPADAVVRILAYGGLGHDNVRIEGHSLLLDMTGVSPGSYQVLVSAASTGHITGEAVVVVQVPVVVVQPIEHILSAGDVFAYTPVTDPVNASISIRSVHLDGEAIDGLLSVSGRTITGTLVRPGTYEVAYSASMPGYVEFVDTVMVRVMERDDVQDSPSLDGIDVFPRPGVQRVYDMVAIGVDGAANIVWTVDGEVFQSSSTVALYEFPTSGVYIVGCIVIGHDGTSDRAEVQVACLDNLYREAAWEGVRYGHIIPGQVDVGLPDDSPFSIEVTTVQGTVYTVISGTPTASDIGRSFAICADRDVWDITVYPREAHAPSFHPDIMVDGLTVTVRLLGDAVSFHIIDFDGDGVDDGPTYTYPGPGLYTVVCKAVNNITTVTVNEVLSLDMAPSYTTVLEDLTDFQIAVGERLDIHLEVEEGDTVSVSGDDTSFVTVQGSMLRFAPTETGVHHLTVTVNHPDGTHHDRTIQVIVRGQPVSAEEERDDYIVVISVLLAIVLPVLAYFVVRTPRKARGYRR